MLILKADRIITGDGKTVIDNGFIKLNDEGIIVETGIKENLKTGDADNVVSYEGSTIMPGLFDLHIHTGNWWRLPDKQNYNDYLIALYTADRLKKILAKGVTTIRDAMSPDGVMRSMKYAAVESKFIKAPRIFHTNVALTPTGGHCHTNHGSVLIADGVEGCRRAVREQVMKGVDFIKAMGNDGDKIDYNQEEMSAIADEAHRLGKKICVHASTTEAIEIAINAGVDTIEHGSFMTEEQAKKMIKSGQVWVPTMVAYFFWADKTTLDLNDPKASPEAVAYARNLNQFFINCVKSYTAILKKYNDMGIKIATGSDNGLAEVDVELKLMCQLGLSPLRAIECATSAAAEVCSIGDKVGRIIPGHIADLLVVNGNPLADISAVSNVREVYQGGKAVGSV